MVQLNSRKSRVAQASFTRPQQRKSRVTRTSFRGTRKHTGGVKSATKLYPSMAVRPHQQKSRVTRTFLRSTRKCRKFATKHYPSMVRSRKRNTSVVRASRKHMHAYGGVLHPDFRTSIKGESTEFIPAFWVQSDEVNTAIELYKIGVKHTDLDSYMPMETVITKTHLSDLTPAYYFEKGQEKIICINNKKIKDETDFRRKWNSNHFIYSLATKIIHRYMTLHGVDDAPRELKKCMQKLLSFRQSLKW